MAVSPEPELPSAQPDPASFSERLRAKHGSDVDPGVSLDAESGPTPTSPTSELVRRLAGHALNGSRYKLQGEVARGGMGAILRVWDEDIRRHLAMKVILGRSETAASGDTPQVEPGRLARFLEEAQITGQLDHPGIVPVHELGLDSEGRVYFTMKLVKGRDLRAIFDLVFAGREGWNETRALSVILKACEAVAYAHAKGVIHRDLKPGNVMVGNFGEVYVMDWGLARVLGKQDAHDIRIAPEFTTSLASVKTERREEREEQVDSPIVTMDGDVVGTPAYMSPEQARGEIEKLGPRSDVYAMGALLYHLLARQVPYVPPGTRLSGRTILSRVIDGPPALLGSIRAGLPAELVAIVEKAMARKAGRRYADTLALAEDLRAYLEGRVVSAYETGTWAETRKWVRRNKALAGSLAAAVLVLVGGGAALLAANTTIRQRNVALAQATTAAKQSELRAIERSREARANSYMAAITAAQAARRLNEPASVRRLLDSAPEELRNWEWRYLDAVSNTSLYSLDGLDPEFSPDGSRILTVGPEALVRVWTVDDGAQISSLTGHAAAVNAAAFSPDGLRIVTASDDKTARVWDPATGQLLLRLDGHTDRLCAASFSPDGTRILTMSEDDTARVWDSTRGTQLVQLEASGDAKPYAYFTHDGKRIITYASDRVVYVWSASDFTALSRLDVGSSHGLSTASRDGTRLLTSDGMILHVWDADSGLELRRLAGHRISPTSTQFSPDGTRIATTSWDKTARVWEASSGNELLQLKEHTSAVRYGSFSPDGSLLLTASSDATACVWDVQSGERVARFEGHTNGLLSAKFSPNGSHIATEAAGSRVLVWDASCIRDSLRFKDWDGLAFRAQIREARFNPDGSVISSASGVLTASLWDTATGDRLLYLTGHSAAVESAVFDPEGACVVTLSEDGCVRLWDVTSGKLQGTLGDIRSRPTSVAFSHDGSRLVTALNGLATCVWDLKAGQELARMEGHSDSVISACFSPNDQQILTASRDGTARLWDASNARELVRMECRGSLTQALFSPDGSRVLTTAEDAHLWNSRDGAETARLLGHTSRITCAAFSPDGSCVATGSADRTVRVWDVAKASEVARCEGHVAPLSALSFCPDGSRLVTSSEDGTARVWNVRTGAECLRLGELGVPIRSASFSPDGSRILTLSVAGSIVIWDSVPNRIRHHERQAARALRGDGHRLAREALDRARGFVAAGAVLRRDLTQDPLVRRAALDALSELARGASERIERARGKRRECTWLSRLLGREMWPDEREVEAALTAELGPHSDPMQVNNRAWQLVRPDAAPSGDEVRGMLLARHALERASPGSVAVVRDTFAWALYRLGRFDEALAEQRRAIHEAAPERAAELEANVHRMESDVARWRDEGGALRQDVIEERIRALEDEIDVLDKDPDVVLWSSEGPH